MSDNKQDFLKEINDEIGAAMGYSAPAPEESPVSRRGQRAALRKKFQLSKKALSWIIVLSLLIVLIGGGTGAYFMLRNDGRRTLEEHLDLEGVQRTAPEEAIVADGGDTIMWNGKTYTKKDSVLNILCLGVDKTTELAETEEDGETAAGGQADTVFLAALDTSTGELTLLNLSRDSMTDVDILNTEGEYVSTEEMQVCLAYAYGDGEESSCLNMARAVSRLTYGLPIDAYAAIDLPAIGILNDAVGGVEVTVLEDLSDRDSALTEGARVLLQGKQAEYYVRSRDKANLESNNQRMARQKQYLVSFFYRASAQIREDWSVALTLYQAVQSYSRTSFRLPQIVYLATLVSRVDFSERDIITIPGRVVMGDRYAEYYMDDDALFQTIIDTYYEEVS